MPHGPALHSERSCSLFPVPGVPRVGIGHVAPTPGSPFEALSHLCARSFNASFGSWYFLSAVIRVPGHLPCSEKAPQRSRSWRIAVFAKGRSQQTLAVPRYRLRYLSHAALFRLRGGIITSMVYVITWGGAGKCFQAPAGIATGGGVRVTVLTCVAAPAPSAPSPGVWEAPHTDVPERDGPSLPSCAPAQLPPSSWGAALARNLGGLGSQRCIKSMVRSSSDAASLPSDHSWAPPQTARAVALSCLLSHHPLLAFLSRDGSPVCVSPQPEHVHLKPGDSVPETLQFVHRLVWTEPILTHPC